MSSFAELGLSRPVLRAVEKSGYTTATPIQAQAIPECLKGNDIVGASQTGTGKTAAFGLPIVSQLTPGTQPQCLILEPTRELAAQVEEQMRNFGYYRPMNVVLLHGGVGYGAQNEGLATKPDVVIATPGRLIDHMERGSLKLDQIKHLVLDEVDRMLDMGFLPDVKRIIDRCPKNRQTQFYSATMPGANVAARGLDITGVTHVINYRVPENPEDYVHRIGRTGRAQKEGDALTILSADELDYAKAVEHFVEQKIDRKKLEGFDYTYTALLDENQKPLRKKRPAPKRRR
ncbi:UNVERIFIED_CONTAM: hypothetical protein GTU68_012755 [Idotea baltica]|nr:hypothetical protein [Idotea baltica]